MGQFANLARLEATDAGLRTTQFPAASAGALSSTQSEREIPRDNASHDTHGCPA